MIKLKGSLVISPGSSAISAAGSILVLLTLASPFLIIMVFSTLDPAFRLYALDAANFGLLFKTLFYASVQAATSALFSILTGLIGALGLLSLKRKFPRVEKAGFALALLPNVTPVLFLILASLKLFPNLRGFTGVVFDHVLLNSGLVSVAIARLFSEKIGAMSELAEVEGVSGWRFLIFGVLTYLRADLGFLALFVFGLCFSSFAIPLIIGGTQAATLEVSIYQTIRVYGNWGFALLQALLQGACLYLIAFCLSDEITPVAESRRPSSRLLSWWPGLLVAWSPALLIFWSLLEGLGVGIGELAKLPSLVRELPYYIAGSFFVAVSTGMLTALALLCLTYVHPRGWLRKFLLGYAAPSSALTGFAILLVWRAGGIASYLKISLGLAMLSVPGFYRLHWDQLLNGISEQRRVAITLGASAWEIFREIALPQVFSACMFAAGVASVWAWGDFAFSNVIGERSLTLAMVIASLIESYRLDGATVLVWIIAVGSLLTIAIFNGVARVYHSKS